MLSQERALQLIQESMASLRRAGLIKEDMPVTGDTVLLGAGSTLDSIAFVTFVVDVEERLDRETGQEYLLVLSDIHDFDPERVSLTGDMLARYIVYLTNK